MDTRIEELVEAFEQELTVEDLELASADNEDLGVEDTLIVNDDDDDDDDDEDEIEDPAVKLREDCAAHCPALKLRLETCTERVNSRSNTAETCTEELQDFLHCVDHCLTKKLFMHLK